MYGKPAPLDCGTGWKGWYKGRFFRSLLELSFMVNYLDKNNLQYSSGEQPWYRIKYVDSSGVKRSYSADFVVGNQLIEIKPSKRINDPVNILKKGAAVEWCCKNGYVYSIKTERDFDPLSYRDIYELCRKKEIKLLAKYKRFLIKYLKRK